MSDPFNPQPAKAPDPLASLTSLLADRLSGLDPAVTATRDPELTLELLGKHTANIGQVLLQGNVKLTAEQLTALAGDLGLAALYVLRYVEDPDADHA